IDVDKPAVTAAPDTTVCPGLPIPLRASGALSYHWSPSTGLTDTAIAGPVSRVTAPIQYFLTGTDAKGCSVTDTVQIDLFPHLLDPGPDTSICFGGVAQLSATGGNNFTWTPGATLSNPAIANPTARPVGNTRYYVTAVDLNNCTERDSVTVRIRPRPPFQ